MPLRPASWLQGRLSSLQQLLHVRPTLLQEPLQELWEGRVAGELGATWPGLPLAPSKPQGLPAWQGPFRYGRQTFKGLPSFP